MKLERWDWYSVLVNILMADAMRVLLNASLEPATLTTIREQVEHALQRIEQAVCEAVPNIEQVVIQLESATSADIRLTLRSPIAKGRSAKTSARRHISSS